jgi:Domain of unknown function (DUF4349)
MARSGLLAALAVLTLAGCGQQVEEYAASAPEAAADMAVQKLTPADGAGAAGSVEPAAIPVSVPKIAYVYDYGYRVAADRMTALQRRHAELCEKQGPANCRIIEMRSSGGEGDYATGSLALEVAAPRARAFGAELAKAAGESGGEEVSSAISGEDLSKQIVDTEARLRARLVLRDRLMEVLATRKGSVAELVEAERGVAQVNEEIDQARSWLAEMQGRVDFSRVNISYASGSPAGGGFLAPIRDVLGNLGAILGYIVALLIVLVTVAVPLGLFAFALRKGWLWLKGRRPAPSAQAD